MKRPNLFIYLSLGLLIKLFAILKGQKIILKKKIKGPAIILSNHTSFYDFIYTTSAMYPHRVSYLAAQKMFFEPITGFFLKLARAIPKSLMQSDPVATLKAFRILKKKGIVSVFPEGQISPTGTSLKPSFSIAKFLKKANVDIYIVKHKNAYLVNPPWSKNTFKGIIETEKELIITKEDLNILSLDDIYSIVTNKLYFSTSSYNKQKRYQYQLNDIKNLENVIYQCPSCLHEGLKSNHDHLFCPKCDYKLFYDKYGLLNQKGIDELFKEQENRLRDIIDKDKKYELKSDVRLLGYKNNRLVEIGQGKLTLKRFEYVYEGLIDNVKKTIKFNVSSTQSLPSDIGRNIQIYEGYEIYQFEMDTAYLPTKFVHVGEYLYLIHQKENKIEKRG